MADFWENLSQDFPSSQPPASFDFSPACFFKCLPRSFTGTFSNVSYPSAPLRPSWQPAVSHRCHAADRAGGEQCPPPAHQPHHPDQDSIRWVMWCNAIIFPYYLVGVVKHSFQASSFFDPDIVFHFLSKARCSYLTAWFASTFSPGFLEPFLQQCSETTFHVFVKTIFWRISLFLCSDITHHIGNTF